VIPELKPYPVMKDSRVECLGRVPEHWRVEQLGRSGRFFKGNGGTKEDEVARGVPCVRYGDLYTRHRFFIEETKSYVSEDRVADYTPIQYGDVLFAASGETIEEIGKSAVNLLRQPACCGGDVVVFRPSAPVNAMFLGLASDCPQAAYQKSRMGRGITVMHVYGDELKYLWVAFPPLSEQAAIARYLDYVDRRVRKLVRAKRKLIALLNEQKQAIIHRAVTRGLDPDVPLKDSGVEWLGEVPEHWSVRQLGRIGVLFKGNGGTKDDEVPEGIPCIRYGDLYNQYESLIDGTRSCVSKDRASDYTAIQRGDVLFAGSGETIEEIGKSAVNLLAEPACCGGDVIVFRPTIPANARFLGYSTDSPYAVHQKSRMGRGITVMHLYAMQLKYLRIALPPVQEQAAIVEYLGDITVRINAGIEHANREVELLKEYRTRLVAGVVTGKLDVREAVSALPEVDPLTTEEESDEAVRDDEEYLDDSDDTPKEPHE